MLIESPLNQNLIFPEPLVVPTPPGPVCADTLKNRIDKINKVYIFFISKLHYY